MRQGDRSMNTKLLIACTALALGACAPTPTRLPDGTLGYSIECNSNGECMNKAAKMCGGPYEIIDTGARTYSGTGGYATTTPVFDPVTRTTTYEPVTVPGTPGGSYNTMVFACRTPPSGAKSDATLQAEIKQEVLKFSQDPRYPHYQRLKLHMAEYLETGRASSLEDAYAKACTSDKQCSAEGSIKP